MSASIKLGTAENQGCCAPWERSSFNPTNWNLTAKKVAQLSAVVVAICAMALLVLGLIHQYPSAYGALFAACGISGTGALISMILASAKHCQEQSRSSLHVEFEI